DSRFYLLLRRLDDDLAATARADGCRVCGGALHSAAFTRKPRGGPADLDAECDKRHSFCCASANCRKRMTPPSVRFLRRKVYLGAVVVLATVLRHGTTQWRAVRLRGLRHGPGVGRGAVALRHAGAHERSARVAARALRRRRREAAAARRGPDVTARRRGLRL